MNTPTLPFSRAWRARTRQRLFRHAPTDANPVILRHSRIYLLPTRRGLALIATLITMLLASLNYGLTLGIGVTFLLTGLLAAAQLHTFRNLAGIEIAPLSAGESFAGGDIAFTLAVHAGSAARISIQLNTTDGMPTARHDIAAGASLTAMLARPTAQRGHVALGRVTLSTDHPFGLWRGWSYVHFPLEGIVFPAPEVSAPPLPAGHGGTNAEAHGRGDDADLAGLREYQRGDPPQRIAWKAVARGAGWFSKEFDGAGDGGPLMLSWTSLPPGLDAEARLSRLTAWVLAAERSARPFALAIPGTMLPPQQGRDHRRTALTALALFDRRRG